MTGEVMCNNLDKYFGSSGLVTYTRPSGGYFLWIKMKDNFNSLELFEEAKKGLPDRNDKVSFQPGPSFTSEPNGFLNYARLSFSYYPEHHFPTAIELLSLLLKRHS
jgi:DNA-binding transcriptional MocR family regulator